MQVFKAVLEAHSYVFTATYERGHTLGNFAYPSHYLHNYALIYSLNGVANEYFIYKNQKLYNFVERKINNGEPIYALPAKPLRVYLKGFTYSTKAELLVEAKRKPQIVAPSSGYYLYFSPYSKFETYIIAEEKNDIPPFIRFGKKREGIFKIILEKIKYQKTQGVFTVNFPFNPFDVRDAVKILDKKLIFSIKGSKKISNPEMLEVVTGRVNGYCLRIVNSKRVIHIVVPKTYWNKL